ncbi:MAG: hypothetical protein Q9179_001452 [Wetmoreana sp. 5 TL-2023]
MSRQHATLSMTSDGTTYDVHLQDLSSTHGTWLGNRRLAPYEKCTLRRTGDLVTFGSTVTSGPTTYHARSFAVELSKPSTDEQVSPGSLSSPSSEKSGFHVPDDDPSSPSDISEADSCQILDSHPRTFSVPSSSDEMDVSDDEDVILSGYRRPHLASRRLKDSQNQHPESHPRDSDSQPYGQGQRPRNESRVGSAVDPIDLDEAPQKLDNVSSDEEESDLSHTESQQDSIVANGNNATSDKTTTSNIPSQVPDTYPSSKSYRMAMENEYSRIEDDERGLREIQNSGTRAESEANEDEAGQEEDTRVRQDSIPAFRNQASFPTTSGDDVSKESTSGYGQSFHLPSSTSEHYYPANAETDHQLNRSRLYYTNLQPEDTTIYGSQAAQAEARGEHMQEDDVEQENVTEVNLQTALYSTTGSLSVVPSSVIQESPPGSPNAREHSPLQGTYFNFQKPRALGFAHPETYSLETPAGLNGQCPQDAYRSPQDPRIIIPRAPSPSDAALARKATLVPGRRNAVSAADHFREYYDPGSRSYRGIGVNPLLNPATQPSIGFSYSTCMTEKQRDEPAADTISTPSPDPYPTLPSLLPHYHLDDWQTDAANPPLSPRPGPGNYHQGPFSRSYRSLESVAMPTGPSEQSNSPPLQKRCLVRLKYENKSDRRRNHDLSKKRVASSIRQIQDGAKSSKVDISNLVNSQPDGSRGLKRKADQMTSTTVAGKQKLLSANDDGRDDANPQPLDPTSTVKEPLTQEQAQDQSQQPAAVIGAVEEGRARKIRKTSKSSKAGTIGKIVSGVCLGLAGAFAAFVAATPADVWEEALRETAKLK